MGFARLLARGTIGALMVGHGTQKLFGWFGGHGPDGTGQFFEQIGFRPGKQHALAAGAAEAGGGALLALGLATPAAAASITGVMLSAIRSVHWKNGVWSGDGGFEYNAVLIASVIGLTETGPGPLSLDARLGIEKKGALWALGALAAGAAGATAAALVSKAQSAPQPEPEPELADEPTAREAQAEEPVTTLLPAPAPPPRITHPG
jgi:putative oxidoreductase